MSSSSEQRFSRFENERGLILGVIVVVILLMTICAASILVLNQRKASLAKTQAPPSLLFVTEPAPKAIPPSNYFVRLPVILSAGGVVSAPASTEQIWRVTRVKYLGYEIGGRRYDMATFQRLDTQDTVKAYCINPGWDTPSIGADYVLKADGIFVPVTEPAGDPLQRFAIIQ